MGSHTVTGEWQSFEARMRRRRAERVLLRAEAAADAGFSDEARACLEEARVLAPNLPGLAAVQQKVDAPPAPATSAASRRRSYVAVAASALVAGAAGVFALLLAQQSRTITPSHDFRDAAVAPIASPAMPGDVPAVSPRADARTSAADAVPALPDGDAADRRITPVSEIARTAPAVEPPAPPIRPVERPAEPEPTVPVHEGLAVGPNGAGVAVPASIVTPAPASAPPPPAAAPPATAAPAPTAAPPPAPESGDAPVRRALERYAAAYSALDAAAAARVWPGVNRGALSRAFGELTSQDVSLGDCRVDVRTVTARADCTGSATWTPKVGDQSPRTEPRRWTFELARHGGDWQIVSARVQNR